MLVPFILYLAEHGRMNRSVTVHTVGTSAPQQETGLGYLFLASLLLVYVMSYLPPKIASPTYHQKLVVRPSTFDAKCCSAYASHVGLSDL